MAGFINSSNIKVFPCGGRNKIFDPLARLTTEYNLVSLINRLVDMDSFIVTTHAKDTDIKKIPDSEFYQINVGGYLFTITSINNIPQFLKNEDPGDSIYLNATIRVDSYADSDYQQLGSLQPISEVDPDSKYEYIGSSPLEDTFHFSPIKDSNTDNIICYKYSNGNKTFYISQDNGTWYYCDNKGNFLVKYTEGILDTHATKNSEFVGLEFSYSTQKMQNSTELTLFEHKAIYSESSTGDYCYDSSTNTYKYLEDTTYPGQRYKLEYRWVECEDSKIKFKTSIDGNQRSVSIDDGVLE